MVWMERLFRQQANNAKRMVDLELGLPFFTLMIFLLS